MKPVIGILLDEATFNGIPGKKTGHERISLYDRSAKKLHLIPFYMSLKKTGKQKAWGYQLTANRYIFKQRSIPKVIHNRDMALSPLRKNQLKALARSSIIFNRTNRFSKYRINRLLEQQDTLRPHIPASRKYSRSNLAAAMKKYDSLFIKPTSGSVGTGIIRLDKGLNHQWDIHWRKGRPRTCSFAQTVESVHRLAGKHSYMIQEAIPLAAFRGRPYDIRVSVQRNGSGLWQVTGMVGKVAAKGQHVTNVAKGGRVRQVEELLAASGFSAAYKKQEIKQLSLAIAEYLGKRLPHLADIGLDIGVSQRGEIKFIEMNGRDQRYSFKKAGMDKTFFHTYLTPMQYASRIASYLRSK